MNRDPFLRLALIALCSLYALGLGLIARYFGVLPLIAVSVGGWVVAGLVTLEFAGEKPITDRRRRQRQPAEGTRGFERIE